MTSLYLASGSPRRRELLAQLGVSFERIVTGIEEKRAEGESAQQYVSRLAREKRRRALHACRVTYRCWGRYHRHSQW